MTPASYLDFVARINGVARSQRRAAVTRALEATKTENVAKQPISTLSRGFKQRVAIAQALVHDPEVLILDEPTIGLDPKQIIEIRNLIKGLAQNRTVILSTHILPEVMQICDKVVIIANGRIVAEDQLDSLTATEDLEQVFLRVTAGDVVSRADVAEAKPQGSDREAPAGATSDTEAAADDGGGEPGEREPREEQP